MHVNRTSMAQPAVHAELQNWELSSSGHEQVEQPPPESRVHSRNQHNNAGIHFQEFQLFKSPYESGCFYSNQINWLLETSISCETTSRPVEPSLLYTIHVSSGCQNTVNGYALSLNLLGCIISWISFLPNMIDKQKIFVSSFIAQLISASQEHFWMASQAIKESSGIDLK